MEHSGIERKKYLRITACFLGLVFLLVVFILWNINAGSVDMSVREIAGIIFRGDGDETSRSIIMKIRMPRILAALLLGGALSVSGFLLQTFFHNPIAGPFVLGISSGAKLVVAMVMVFMLGNNRTVTSAGMMTAAFLGSMISMGFVLLVSRRVHSMSMLVICGVMISYICSAVTEFVIAFAEDSNIVNLHNWSMGSFASTTWTDIRFIVIITVVAVISVFMMSKPIGAYQLGEAYARNMGVNIKMFRLLLILLSSILSACVTAFAGPISFVGIAVPHLIKNVFGTAKPLVMIPACFLGGSIFCLVSDLIARTAFAPTELSISSVTAVFGAPIVIYIMISRQKGKRV